MKNITLSLLALFAVAVSPVQAAFNSDSKGLAGAQFLKLGAGARAAAMGEGFSSAVDDATAIYWNPGALPATKNASISLMHAMLFEDISYQFLGYSKRVDGDSAFGIGVTRLSAGGIKHTDSNGIETGDTSSPSDIAVSLGYAKPVNDWSFGAAAKYIRSSIVKSATALAVDAGILSPELVGDSVRLSLAVQNIGTKLKFDKESDPLPLNIKTGVSFKFSDQLLGAVDLNFPYDNGAYLGAGAEYWFTQGEAWGFAGRGGYNTRTMGDISGINGFSVGLGAVISHITIDYAFVPFGDIGNSHRISLGFTFGSGKKNYAPVSQKTVPTSASAPKSKPVPAPIVKINETERYMLMLSSDSWQARQQAAEILGGKREKLAVKSLINALNDEDERVSASAAIALGEIGDAGAFQDLIDSLSDSSPLVRAAAAKSLGKLGDRRAISPLKKILRDESKAVREAVSKALLALAYK